MCGICGFLGSPDTPLLKRMTQSMSHRGPDEEGFFTDGPVSLGHRRLSIIDLGGGKQPIHNEDETVWIVFNGEIYNFKELRSELEGHGHRFYTNSDTEAIVHAYEEFGFGFGKRLEGIFAAALWDSSKKRLVLIRDQLGTKPLYYTTTREGIVFASEIKAILEHPEVERHVDTTALNQYLTYRYVPDPRTMFEGIRKLSPASTLVVQKDGIKLDSYWDFSLSPALKDKTLDECAQRLRRKLQETVDRQMISDVPLGAFLSGGIDSSALVALMSRSHPEPIKTFTVGFPEGDDESRMAQLVADHLGTDHHHKDVKIDSLSILPELIWHLDEPIADSAIIPTYLISKFARTKVTVVLSGEGADESFGGYPKYREILNRTRLPLPPQLHALSPALEGLPWHGKPVRVMEHLVRSRNLPEYYLYTSSIFKEYEKVKLLKGGYERTPSLFALLGRLERQTPGTMMLYWDMKTFLPGDLLMKADKMSMAASIELRVPYLDPVLVDYSMDIPFQHKVHPQPKAVLRKAVSDLLPPEVLGRKKQGFNVPISKWLESGLGNTEDLMLGTGYFNQPEILKLVDQHKKGLAGASQKLWGILCFGIWHEIFINKNRKVSI